MLSLVALTLLSLFPHLTRQITDLTSELLEGVSKRADAKPLALHWMMRLLSLL